MRRRSLSQLNLPLVNLSEQVKKKESEILKLRKKQLELLEKNKKLEEELPHIYVPMYEWQRKIHESDNRVNLLTAANQIGKSSALIRRVIANATDNTRWERLWGPGAKPKQFWYFYPDSNTLEREIDTKWVPEWMPRGKYEGDIQYGWKLTKKNNRYNSCVFNAGPIIYFQTYSKSVSSVQAGTIHETICDEEMPMEFYDEIMFRLTSTAGIFTSGFTPTLNQLFWKKAMEGQRILPSALKLTISMYDCLKYEDGSPSRVMTLNKIKLAESKCKNETERQRRVYGKFVTEHGRTYYAFDYDKNMVKPYNIRGWFIYAAVDYGSGLDEGSKVRKRNHPAAIVFIAVRPDYKKGAIFKSWRGDAEKTTAGDVFLKYQELSKGMVVTQACYDPSSVDFGTIALRNGVGFLKADKSRDAGEDLINTLFKHKLLDVFDEDVENLKLASELLTMMIHKQEAGGKSGDDLADALRYGCKMIPWDLTAVDEALSDSEEGRLAKVTRPLTDAEQIELQIKMRRGEDVGKHGGEQEGWGELEAEFDHWNQEY